MAQSRNQSRGTSASATHTPITSSLPSNSTKESPRPLQPPQPPAAKTVSLEVPSDEILSDASEDDIGPQSFNHNDDAQYSSKMDKYFSSSYDPRLDVAPTLTAPDSLIPPDAFDNWNYMLEVVRKRREEKEERKRLEKLHGKDSKKKKKESQAESLRSAEMNELLSMQYTKRGGVREWDEGKDS